MAWLAGPSSGGFLTGPANRGIPFFMKNMVLSHSFPLDVTFIMRNGV
jgi:hypothetical protein